MECVVNPQLPTLARVPDEGVRVYAIAEDATGLMTES
jgi:hypothetical protein